MTATTDTTLLATPYLREQRAFPYEEVKDLSRQVDQAYIDIANKVNKRVIGTYAQGFMAVTGESWFLAGTNKRQQTLRQIYPFTVSGAITNIPHGIPANDIVMFTMIYGTATDETNWYPLPYVASAGTVANQISVVVGPVYIIVTKGASAPAITTGNIVLEWMTNF